MSLYRCQECKYLETDDREECGACGWKHLNDLNPKPKAKEPEAGKTEA